MKVSLRKADALVKALSISLKSIRPKVRLPVSVYKMPGHSAMNTELAALRETAQSEVARLYQTVAIITEIRRQLGVKNVEAGIHDLLTEKNGLDALEAATKAFKDDEDGDIVLAWGEALDFDIAQRQLTAMEERNKTATYGARDTLTILTALPPLADNRKRRVAINDELLTLNMTNTITLSPEAVALLEQADLL